jgi:glycosyltransferase involved in cell wall biosynthesis
MVVHDYYPLDARAVREAKAAAGAGYRVDVICLTDVGERKREVIDGIHVHRLAVSRNRGAGLWRMMREYVAFATRAGLIAMRIRIRNHGASEHIVQVHAPPDFLIVAGLLPKLLGSKLILDIHDLTRHLFMARFEGRRVAPAAHRLLARIERVACAMADQVVTVHEPYRQELISNGVSGSRVAVVMNAVDDELIAQVVRSRGGGAADGASFTIAYHGSITPSYGVDLIIEALPYVLGQVPGVRCMILGGGDAVPALEDRAAELGVADRITFSRRFLPIEIALSQVTDADCGLIPNRPSELNRFALSSKLFEYVALGLPAVVARLETLAKHFGPDEVTFFEPGDPRSFARAITWVAMNPSGARTKAERARARGQEYSWMEHRARYLAVLGSTDSSSSRFHTAVRSPFRAFWR